MKQILAVVIMACALGLAHADLYELRKVIYCDTHEAIFTALAQDFLEQPVWAGFSDAQSTRLLLTANPKTGTWTMVEYGEDFACVIAVGRDHKSLSENRERSNL
jgi:hypothetical protein